MNLIKALQCFFWGHVEFKVYRGGRDLGKEIMKLTGITCGRCGRWKSISEADNMETYGKEK